MLRTGNAFPKDVASKATIKVMADIELRATKNLHPGLKTIFCTVFCS